MTDKKESLQKLKTFVKIYNKPGSNIIFLCLLIATLVYILVYTLIGLSGIKSLINQKDNMLSNLVNRTFYLGFNGAGNTDPPQDFLDGVVKENDPEYLNAIKKIHEEPNIIFRDFFIVYLGSKKSYLVFNDGKSYVGYKDSVYNNIIESFGLDSLQLMSANIHENAAKIYQKKVFFSDEKKDIKISPYGVDKIKNIPRIKTNFSNQFKKFNSEVTLLVPLSLQRALLIINEISTGGVEVFVYETSVDSQRQKEIFCIDSISINVSVNQLEKDKGFKPYSLTSRYVKSDSLHFIGYQELLKSDGPMSKAKLVIEPKKESYYFGGDRLYKYFDQPNIFFISYLHNLFWSNINYKSDYLHQLNVFNPKKLISYNDSLHSALYKFYIKNDYFDIQRLENTRLTIFEFNDLWYREFNYFLLMDIIQFVAFGLALLAFQSLYLSSIIDSLNSHCNKKKLSHALNLCPLIVIVFIQLIVQFFAFYDMVFLFIVIAVFKLLIFGIIYWCFFCGALKEINFKSNG